MLTVLINFVNHRMIFDGWWDGIRETVLELAALQIGRAADE